MPHGRGLCDYNTDLDITSTIDRSGELVCVGTFFFSLVIIWTEGEGGKEVVTFDYAEIRKV